MPKPLILILCTGNSCRSQMAEAILAKELGGVAEVASAGSEPAGHVHPLALSAIKEIGLSLPEARSKNLSEFLDRDVHTVITVCGNADAKCPTFPGQLYRHHWGFEDPAHFKGDEEEALPGFRRVRDEIAKVFGAYADGFKSNPTEKG